MVNLVGKENKMIKKRIYTSSLIVIVLLIVSIVTVPANATTFSENTQENQTDRLSAIIMTVQNENDREQIANYFFAPAYEKYEILDEDDNSYDGSFESLNSTEKNIQLENEALELSKLTGNDLKVRIEQLAEEHAQEIINDNDAVLTNEYVKYAESNFKPSVVANIKQKYSADSLKEVGVNEYILDSNSSKAAAKTNKKTFKQTYGSKSKASYCAFWSTVTWKTSGGKITSLSSTTTKPTTPFYITPTSAVKNTTKTSSDKKTGYVQKAWGYVNVSYGDGKINGYYVLDIKVFGSNSSKMKGSTVAPIAYPNYKWGNF